MSQCMKYLVSMPPDDQMMEIKRISLTKEADEYINKWETNVIFSLFF